MHPYCVKVPEKQLTTSQFRGDLRAAPEESGVTEDEAACLEFQRTLVSLTHGRRQLYTQAKASVYHINLGVEKMTTTTNAYKPSWLYARTL